MGVSGLGVDLIKLTLTWMWSMLKALMVSTSERSTRSASRPEIKLPISSAIDTTTSETKNPVFLNKNEPCCNQRRN